MARSVKAKAVSGKRIKTALKGNKKAYKEVPDYHAPQLPKGYYANASRNAKGHIG